MPKKFVLLCKNQCMVEIFSAKIWAHNNSANLTVCPYRPFCWRYKCLPTGGGGWRIWRGNTTSQHRRENLIQTRRRSPMHNPNDGGKRWALLLLPLCRLFPLPPPLPSISAVAVLISAVASPPPLSHFPATAHFQYEVLIIPLILVFSVADFLYSDFWNQFTRCLQLISMSLRNAICGWSFRVPNSDRLWS